MASNVQLFVSLAQFKPKTGSKVTIVGSGAVGSSIAFSILLRGITSEVVIVSRDGDKVKGEVLDLQDGWNNFMKNVKISGGNDLNATSGSQLIIFTAGEKKLEGESRLDLIQKNVNILKALVPKLVHLSPDAVWLIVSFPSDILSFVTWKLSGLSKSRIIGCGTSLDSTRFRRLIAEKANLYPSAAHAWVIGEQGASSIPLWSSVDIAGIKLQEINPLMGRDGDKENWSAVHKEAVDCEANIIKLKHKSHWGIALNCSDIANDVINSSNEVRTVSTLVKGFHKISKEVFMSLPCTISSNGIVNVINLKTTSEERSQLLASANTLDEVQKSLNF
jgi:L-lactate dehydrogenase